MIDSSFYFDYFAMGIGFLVLGVQWVVNIPHCYHPPRPKRINFQARSVETPFQIGKQNRTLSWIISSHKAHFCPCQQHLIHVILGLGAPFTWDALYYCILFWMFGYCSRFCQTKPSPTASSTLQRWPGQYESLYIDPSNPISERPWKMS